MFKRRNKRSFAQIVAHMLYPRGGWLRAASYVWHRLRRLPDPPHRIARGIAAGVFVCYTPFFGFHFILAASIALLIRGNVLAALLATFYGNPFTFPIIATLSVDLGNWILGLPPNGHMPSIIGSFSNASAELWSNLKTVFTGGTAHWGRLHGFFRWIFLPYLVGGLLPGLVSAAIAYLITNPIITAYQAARIQRLKKRYEKRMKARARENIRADAPSESR